jgi:hypothetical protein
MGYFRFFETKVYTNKKGAKLAPFLCVLETVY